MKRAINIHILTAAAILAVLTVFAVTGPAAVNAETADADNPAAAEVVLEGSGSASGSDQAAGDPALGAVPAREPAFALMVNGSTVMYIESREAAEDALSSIVTKMVPKGTTLKSYSYKEKVRIVGVPGSEIPADEKVLNTKQAVKLLKQKMAEKTPLLTVRIVSDKYKTSTVKYHVKFKYKKSMLPFEFETKSKGKNGKLKICYQVVSTNGEVSSSKKSETTTLLKAKDAVVYTGKADAKKNLTWAKYKKYKAKIEKQALKLFGDYALGKNVVDYGKLFLGNPYKYGGKSLTNGIDCVQFIIALYKKYGIKLPENKRKFYQVGKKISLKDARAGDIIYYGSHVALYMGNGKVIHAQHRGIAISNVHYRKISFIRRVR